ncbi:hypothetical protein ACBI99_44890 [Nonomuraea sp. ATR24]|uniref:hypothetical protein n=1 Tax=Nonomuraea sp. ATR24 TaxID=1676744 RepID=UPI0035C0CD4F
MTPRIWTEEIDRPGRDGLAAEARELWNVSPTGQTRIALAESQVDAIMRILTAFTVYSPVAITSDEPIALLITEVKESLCAELGRARTVAALAAEKRAGTVAHRRRIREAEAARRTTAGGS